MKLRFVGEDGSMELKMARSMNPHLHQGKISVGRVESQSLFREILPLLLYQGICAELGAGKYDLNKEDRYGAKEN